MSDMQDEPPFLLASLVKWDNRFLDMAKLVASWSKDPSTRCGAVIVRPDRTISSLGFNGFPRGIEDAPALLNNRDEKLSRVIHAEMNAILSAKEPVTGHTLYVYPFMPCDRCAVHIIQAGIARVVTLTAQEDKLLRWKDAFDRSLSYFREAGVQFHEYSTLER